MGHQSIRLRPLHWTRRRTLNSRGLLMTVSMRRTWPNLSYIFSQLFLTRCLTRAPGQRSFLQSVSTSPSKCGCRPAQERQDVLGTEVKAGMIQQAGIELGQGLPV